MTVDELRKAIAGVPGDRNVLITLEDDEFGATCVTISRLNLRICKSQAGISGAETILNCPKCDAEIGDSYEPDDPSIGICGGKSC